MHGTAEAAMQQPCLPPEFLSFLSCSSHPPNSPEGCMPASAPPSGSSVDDAIAHIVIQPESLRSFMELADVKEDPDHTSSLPASEAKEEGEVRLPALVTAVQGPAGARKLDKRSNQTHIKQACVSCRQKKQKCEDGRPCHRCINALRICADSYMVSRKRTRVSLDGKW